MDQPTSTSSTFRLSTWLAWFFCGLVCIFTLIYVGLNLKNLLAGGNMIQMVSNLIQGLLAAVFSFVAALITFRQPRNRIGWLLMAPAISFIAVGLIETSLGRFTSAPPPTIPNLIMTWFSGWSWLLFIYPLFFILLLFPTGKPLSPRWRWILAFALGMCLFFILYATFSQTFRESNNKWT
jgi:hypothetical protein